MKKYTIVFKSGNTLDFNSPTLDIDFEKTNELRPLKIISAKGKSLWINLAEVEYIIKENEE